MQRIAINGFGRIGRNVLRAWFENPKQFQFEIVAINDIADVQTLAHLFKYDTTHGRFAGQVEVQIEDEKIFLNIQSNQRHLHLQVLKQAQPEQLPWKDLNIDVVLECTGLFRSRADATRHILAGAKRVIIGAAPFDSVDAAIVYGVNHAEVKATDQIISSVSCTTQALVPLVKIIDDAFGIETALMTEIHAVTADQSVLDHAHRDLRRARASGQNIIPTTSSALGALKQVMPKMENRIDGYSIRVPTINVAAIDLTFISQSPITVHKVNEVLTKAAKFDYAQIMQVTDENLVSSDFNHSPYSLIVDLTQTIVVGHQAKVFAWYDNEWGYANRLLDLCESFDSKKY
ncbi:MULTISPECIES: type I glyceraldehyde-3-phosphate dehydrogenase [unclassified Acinetobacter]|uniref:type I glyceraldehyde-3-phosphate dehydrogenase n=1 Tax=unclassified Acinetobacter TaxID=196816 RepID=UPI00244A92AA|nr:MULTISPECIES: type I glyceraldehyde-3-phosphate dehydrogenase [unclassified Acinetobacter]MDH0031812.1 glyceraldehyde-3-phosphate dehydrogenase [Acinetobacter sp. GD04021]MDH0886127.1 glyceraldehyde-3-phosphate dehydrogenase [Acinetobacter sp. GD03873]MDH1082747.1 glyceraldehyde-3-phosphate dehydrogenase [Acinetobacter sp. GD03983]MDH2189458.1 glyceraldehyde-3-phosphate dehydrogenase [Acinetobacter sp. GD03645]MDH2204836.1 glyceraldehyde-3-phosphate dehydrogenase [Acinetobacter sp. GD03647]